MKIDYQELKKVRWYRQATDSVPYFIFGPSVAVQKLVNGDFNFIVSGKADHWRAFINEDYYLRKAKIELGRFRKNKNYLYKLHTNWLVASRRLLVKVESIRRLDLRRLSNEQIIALNKDLGRAAYSIWLVPFFLDIFDPNADLLIDLELKKAGLKLLPSEISTMLQPNQPLETQKYHLELYKLLLKRYKQSDFKSIANKYYFINCSYAAGTGLLINQIKDDLKNLYRQADLKVEVRKLENYQQHLRLQKKKIYSKYKMLDSLVDFFGFFAELGLWRDQRKATLQKTVFALNLLGREIARRSRRPWLEISLCAPSEIDSIPVKKSLISKARARAENNYMMIWSSRLQKLVLFDKKTSKKLAKVLEPSTDLVEIRGQSANLGRVNGRIRVIRGEQDFKKFKLNEILVTAMTRPEFLPLMRKAAAVITDEGGVTSHAAIVSRELNKPCIIGTRIATRVLKNGDLVEVNANHGWVRKINHKKRP